MNRMQNTLQSAAVVAAGAGAGTLAAHNFDIPAPIISVVASFISLLGAAVIRWFERKVLKQQADAAADQISALQKDVEFWKAQAKSPYSGRV